jgi:hypothetical protein
MKELIRRIKISELTGIPLSGKERLIYEILSKNDSLETRTKF